jgi:rSAM/selenodomain-associated transferase 2
MVSVIIPTLNEEAALPDCLASVGEGADVEVVVSDGGSSDRTVALARSVPGVRVIEGGPGRGHQLRRGASAASGDFFVFLHADCRLPEGWREAVEQTLRDPAVALACFRLATEPVGPAGRLRRLWFRLLDLRSLAPLMPYGDQGFTLRREVYDQAGGFQPIPLMEDVALAGSCRRLGRVRRIPLAIRTSARRFQQQPVRTRLMTISFPWLFRCGVPPHLLARWYGEVR